MSEANSWDYVAIVPEENGRCAIDELDMEVGLLDGWVRFWHQGKLLPLPADLQRSLEEAQHALQESRRQLADANYRAESAEGELPQLRAQFKNGKN